MICFAIYNLFYFLMRDRVNFGSTTNSRNGLQSISIIIIIIFKATIMIIKIIFMTAVIKIIIATIVFL